MLQTVAYAKFTVLAKDGDWDLAELSLKVSDDSKLNTMIKVLIITIISNLLKVLLQNAPYDLAIDVIRIFLEGHQGDTRSKGVELYRVMANKFSM